MLYYARVLDVASRRSARAHSGVAAIAGLRLDPVCH
jgi:hypothetical protein